MNFLAPLAFLGALIAVPIILLYMLRLRRQEVTVSSTYLWQQVLQDNEANTPWQRLRRNLLLLLQLLILLLLILALARPFLTVPAVSAGQITVLLDASASMNATDIGSGETRFSEAQRRALEIVDTMSAGDQMTVIRAAAAPEVLASSTGDRGVLRNAINNAAPDFAEADWISALNLAAASGTGADDFSIVIVSDGGLPDDAGLPGVESDVIYIPVGISGENTAITALAARTLPGGTTQLYAEITNFGAEESRVIFTLFVDDERFATTTEDIPPGESQAIISSALPDDFATLRATLTQSVNSPTVDYLALDDEAFAVAAPVGTRRVLIVTQGNIYLEQVLRSQPGVEAVRTTGATGIPPGFDLYIFDNMLPAELPTGDLMFINPPGDTDLFSVGAQTETTSNPRAESADPRMAFVDAGQLNILRQRTISGADWADALISTDGGPLLLAGEVDGRQVAVMPFDLRESDLPLQITWPVLMANLLEWFAPRAALTSQTALNLGDSVTLRPPLTAETVRITRPDGETDEITIAGDTVLYSGTTAPGLYTVEVLAAGDVIAAQPFAVNLFSPLESSIAPVPLENLSIEGATLALADEAELGQREYWPLAALLALIVLLIEWYVYHRRLRVPTIMSPVTPGRARA